MDLVRDVPQQDFDRILRAVGDNKEDWKKFADLWETKHVIKAAEGAQVARAATVVTVRGLWKDREKVQGNFLWCIKVNGKFIPFIICTEFL